LEFLGLLLRDNKTKDYSKARSNNT